MASKTKEAHYRRLNGKYLKDADELLQKGDYVQASEKLWGAAAEIVKAVAAKRGIKLGAHRSLTKFVVELDEEQPKLNLATEFSVANNLHINFYEDWLHPSMVLKNAETVKSFVSKMERFL
jgi:hypothetical protein